MRLRTLLVAVGALLSVVGSAQKWIPLYEQGLKAAKDGKWAEARTAFLGAIAYRPDDASLPTRLPGPVTEARTWRSGAPYSANFLAAYSAYRQALGMTGDDAATLMKTAAAELEERIQRNQGSRATFFVLDSIYARLGDTAKKEAAAKVAAGLNGNYTWKVDTEVVTPEDLAVINPQPMGGNDPGVNPAGTPGILGGGTATTPAGSVMVVPSKYALIIGNSECQIPGAALPFASNNAQLIRKALMTSAGYAEGNIDIVINGTQKQMFEAAKALSERIPEEATVLIYFAGTGACIGNRDYLAGVDATSASDTTNMLAKRDLYDLFLRKESRIFAFFEANRPKDKGQYFGKEVPTVGHISQQQATTPGETVLAIYREGNQVGLFADSFAGTLTELRSNRLPIMEFGWQLFNRVRRGNTGNTGGASRQTPTLPVVTNMSHDAKF
jgi:hypothetical protein